LHIPHFILLLLLFLPFLLSSHLSFLFPLYFSLALRDLHSFPTRRSSDLFLDILSFSRKSLSTIVGVIMFFYVLLNLEKIVKPSRSEEHTSELQSRFDLVCRLLLEKKNKTILIMITIFKTSKADWQGQTSD